MRIKIVKILVFVLSLTLLLPACGNSNGTDEKEVSPKDYEGKVFSTFWEGACELFGVEYSEYKTTHTAYSYIQDFETSDGYTSHYYLIETAFETENVFGHEILHPVTARCYYVPEFSSTVYTTYLTLDGESIYFDEETEDWLMGIGDKTADDIEYEAIEIEENKTAIDVGVDESNQEDDYYSYEEEDYYEYEEEFVEYDYDEPAENLWPGALQIEDATERDIYILTEEDLSDWTYDDGSGDLDGIVIE